MDKAPATLSKAAMETRERLKSRLDEEDVRFFRTMAKTCSQQMMFQLTGISLSDISHICGIYGITSFQIRKGGPGNLNSALIARAKLNVVKDHAAALAKLKAKFPGRSA
ncbi:MAG: hypothetical protein KBD05_03200 [Candidatus Pacebacteria bacterium]|nr:hypothetical protein [Candidatus Paceibacterota bacterium]